MKLKTITQFWHPPPHQMHEPIHPSTHTHTFPLYIRYGPPFSHTLTHPLTLTLTLTLTLEEKKKKKKKKRRKHGFRVASSTDLPMHRLPPPQIQSPRSQALRFRPPHALLPLHPKGLLIHAPAYALVRPRLSTHALSLFPPLAGRLTTDSHGYVYIACNDAGADFSHVYAKDIHVRDLLGKCADVPPQFKRFFPCDLTVSYHAHFRPILAVRLTGLADGVFIGCALNHAVTDGTSFWNFFNTFAAGFQPRLASYISGGAEAAGGRPQGHLRRAGEGEDFQLQPRIDSEA